MSLLFDLLMRSLFIAMRTEFFNLQPFGCVSPVLFCGVSRNTWRTLGRIGSAFGTLKSDDDADALVFSHKDVMSLKGKW